jgi:septal ring factor EnvC (AmiA/AmiB activator)
MKTKVALVVLVVVCLGLLVALVVRSNQAAEEHQQDVAVIVRHSNDVVKTSLALQDQEQVNAKLTKDIEDRKADIVRLSNDLTQAAETLTNTTASMTKIQTDLQNNLKEAQDELAKRDAKITELEAQKDSLDKQAADLRADITGLEGRISDTQKKLAASEGDKAFLQKELKRLLAEKEKLEQQFNDIVVLRAQVHKLKEELTIARRLDWMRRGIFAGNQEEGGQKLIEQSSGTFPPMVAASTNRYNLNVEINSDGSVRTIPPLTNAPPATPPPAPQ